MQLQYFVTSWSQLRCSDSHLHMQVANKSARLDYLIFLLSATQQLSKTSNVVNVPIYGVWPHSTSRVLLMTNIRGSQLGAVCLAWCQSSLKLDRSSHLTPPLKSWVVDMRLVAVLLIHNRSSCCNQYDTYFWFRIAFKWSTTFKCTQRNRRTWEEYSLQTIKYCDMWLPGM